MKARLGGLLTIALGAVLITNGLTGTDAGQVGDVVPTCGAAVHGIAVVCPTGVINVAEITTPTPVAGDPTPPGAGWEVKITSTCLDPATALPVDQTVFVPNGSDANSTPVEVFTNEASTTHCQYNYAETAVTGFTTTYDTVSPFTIPFGGGVSNSGIKVSVTNSFVHTPPSTSAAPSTPSTPASSSSGTLANTGPRTRITTSVYIGSALVLLGMVMLFGGSRRRSGKRT